VRVLVINAGSSSLKLQLLDGDDLVVEHTVERWGQSDDSSELARFVDDISEVDAVGHRVVHGGDRYSAPVLITDEVLNYLVEISNLAPLHQPKAVAGIRELRKYFPDVPQVACFDTAFHSTIPKASATYALPAKWNERWKLRRYGFHGLSHSYAAGQCAHLLGTDLAALRIVTCHLGAGASLAAIAGGISVDTTMGFTPLEGLVMATRSGTLDPGLLLWLIREGGLSVAELSAGLELGSGLAGLSGTSGDVRDVNAQAQAGSVYAQLALDVFDHRLATMIGSMVVSAGGLDALVFTGGTGEHQPGVRANAVAALRFLDVQIDDESNEKAIPDTIVSTEESAVKVLVVAAREDLQIAREVAHALEE